MVKRIKDYYKILGIERTASSKQIKENYLRLARLYHPDLAEQTEENRARIAEINEAYDVLGDLDKRLQYGVLLHNCKKEQKEIDERILEYKLKRKKNARKN